MSLIIVNVFKAYFAPFSPIVAASKIQHWGQNMTLPCKHPRDNSVQPLRTTMMSLMWHDLKDCIYSHIIFHIDQNSEIKVHT